MDEKLLKKIFGDVPIMWRSDWACFTALQDKTVCFKNNNGVIVTCDINGKPIKLSGKISNCRQDIINFMRNNGVLVLFVYYGKNNYSGHNAICVVEVV